MRFSVLVVVVSCALAAGCDEKKPTVEAPTSRFAGVSQKPIDVKQFCDRTWPASGDGARRYQGPPTRPVDGAPAVKPATGWRWVNLWATWCTPCVDEMPLLEKWGAALGREGVDVSFELISIDETSAEGAMKGWLGKLPGALSWVKSPDEVPSWLASSVGLSADSAIPIHLLVDPSGALRCARVGAVHAQDYGAVKAFLAADAR